MTPLTTVIKAMTSRVSQAKLDIYPKGEVKCGSEADEEKIKWISMRCCYD